MRSFFRSPGLGPLLVKAVAGSAGLRVAGMGFGFLVGVQLARSLGVEGYGTYGIAMAAITMLGVPSEFGLPQLLTREVAVAHHQGDDARLQATRRWALRVALTSSGCILLATLAWAGLAGSTLARSLVHALLVGTLMIPLVAVAKLNSATLRGMQQLVRGQLPDTLVRPAAYSCLLALWAAAAGASTPVVAMSLGVVSVSMALLVSWRMLAPVLPSAVVPAKPLLDRGSLWRAAAPMALTEGLRIVQAQLGVMLLGLLSTVAVVGLYRVSASVVTFIAMPISLFNIVGGPVIARLHAARETRRLQRLLAWLSAGMFAGTLLMSMPFFIGGHWLLGTVFGADFAAATPILQVLCIGVIVNGIFGANAMLLNMSGHETRVTRASIASVIVLVLLLPLGAWLAEGVGAAWATTAALSLWNVVLWRDARGRLGLDATFLSMFRSSATVAGLRQ